MALRRLPATASVDDLAGELDEHGYALVERLWPDDRVAAALTELEAIWASTPTGRNEFEGYRTQRIYALLAKTRVVDELALHPVLLGAADRVLGRHNQLSAPVALTIGPGEAAQLLHRDDDIYPIPRPHPQVVLNSMWALRDYTAANGATRLVPGSHRWDPERRPRGDETVAADMPAGSTLVYVGGLWHGGGANRTDAPRPGVLVEYVAGWLRPQETQLLAVPPDIVRDLAPRLQELLGYGIYPPFLGYVDGRHPRRSLERSLDRAAGPMGG
jgi:ectoine hydroxylase-related dioxygenase (phytanoyl-CoA dioxygenase family)